jgi:CheY-like chemotaxis protein
LGLYSLSKRVEALGGQYGVRSREDDQQGSVFWFSIPYRPDYTQVNRGIEETTAVDGDDSIINVKTGDNMQITSQKQNDQRSAKILSSKSTKSKRILLVDDTQTILKITSKILLSSGYEVETAENGSEALEKLKSAYDTHAFDLCITDLQMPVMGERSFLYPLVHLHLDLSLHKCLHPYRFVLSLTVDGLEFVRRYREFESTRKLTNSSHNSTKTVEPTAAEWSRLNSTSEGAMVIIGMSANSNDTLLREVLGVGMNAFIAKPFSISELERTLYCIENALTSAS